MIASKGKHAKELIKTGYINMKNEQNVYVNINGKIKSLENERKR